MSDARKEANDIPLQERVRIFNLGTPTQMHLATHDLVNDLWEANADMSAALRFIRDAVATPVIGHSLGELNAKWRAIREKAESAITAAVADRPADAGAK